MKNLLSNIVAFGIAILAVMGGIAVASYIFGPTTSSVQEEKSDAEFLAMVKTIDVSGSPETSSKVWILYHRKTGACWIASYYTDRGWAPAPPEVCVPTAGK
jgi:hypothetical protein